jgi:hypothetical protein
MDKKRLAVQPTKVPATKDEKQLCKTTDRPPSKPEVVSIPACDCGCG